MAGLRKERGQTSGGSGQAARETAAIGVAALAVLVAYYREHAPFAGSPVPAGADGAGTSGAVVTLLPAIAALARLVAGERSFS